MMENELKFKKVTDEQVQIFSKNSSEVDRKFVMLCMDSREYIPQICGTLTEVHCQNVAKALIFLLPRISKSDFIRAYKEIMPNDEELGDYYDKFNAVVSRVKNKLESSDATGL